MMSMKQQQPTTFDFLFNVSQLVQDMADVTFSFLSSTVSQELSITLKNLLIDKYIEHLDPETRSFITNQRVQFKDWLAEKLTLVLSNHIDKPYRKYTSVSNIESTHSQDNYEGHLALVTNGTYQVKGSQHTLKSENDIQIPQLPPVTNHVSILQSTIPSTKACTYCIEIISFTISDSCLKFDSAAQLFNAKYRCNMHVNSKVVRQERLRRNKGCSTQLYKCNCCTTDLLLQFRHYDSDIHHFSTMRSYKIGVFAKKKNHRLFNIHFSPRSSK